MKKRIFLASFLVIAVIILLEILMRIAFPVSAYYEQPMYKFHPLLGHSFKRGHAHLQRGYEGENFIFTTNSEGWRDLEFQRSKKNGKIRIIFLGDSFLEAAGVFLENTLPKVTERRLNRKKDKYKCLNFGLGDIGQSEEYLIWKNYAKYYKPDIVVLQMFPLNDVLNNSMHYAAKYNCDTDFLRPYIDFSYNGKIRIRYKNSIPSFLRRHFALYREIELRCLSFRQKNSPEKRHFYKKMLRLNTERGELPTGESLVFLDENIPAEWNMAWGHTKDLVIKIKEEVEKEGAEFYVVVIPWLEQITKEQEFKKIIDKNGKIHYYKMNFNKPEEILMAFFRKNNIKHYFVLYTLRDYINITGKDNASLWGDGHLNKEGLKIVGEALAARLEGIL